MSKFCPMCNAVTNCTDNCGVCLEEEERRENNSPKITSNQEEENNNE